MSPPPPPAGPVPVPYPNTSFSRDMKQGTKRVTINGKPVMLRDQSFYATSPLGNEAATRNFGGSLVTHTITGKTYFTSWSMDVLMEGKMSPAISTSPPRITQATRALPLRTQIFHPVNCWPTSASSSSSAPAVESRAAQQPSAKAMSLCRSRTSTE
ncbi:PAAR-like domain-containing protein [Archangium violaceum]|uniref:PAAR-like domain-containing protein n=1 Tax=Archangium violaceum TaxID=83451 RepID=UPI003D2AE45A